MDDFSALRALVEWGADEALDDAPRSRFVTPGVGPVASPAPALVSPASVSSALVSPASVHSAAINAPSLTAGSGPGVGGGELVGAPAAVAQAERLAQAADTLEGLRAALSGFDGCALRATATNLVFTDGNPDAGLVLIGEGPGAEEDREGRPFVGASGRLLDKMLASVGLDRSKYLISNTIFWRPPGNRTPTDQEVAACLPFVLRMLQLTRPRRVVLLGKMAASTLSGNQQGIRRLRGQWLDLRVPGLAAPIPALATLHPAYLLRTPSAKREAWMDMLALRAALDSDALADSDASGA